MQLPRAGEIKTIWKKWGRHIFEQTFTFANGRSDDFFVFNTVSDAQPVIVFPLTRDREVVAIQQFRTGANAVVYELPGGVPKSGQTAEDVLRSELIEETGYRPGSIVPFNQKKLWFEPASLRVSYVPFLALDCALEKQQELDENELIEVVKVGYDEWIELVKNGTIEDDKTIAITFLADLYLRTNPR